MGPDGVMRALSDYIDFTFAGDQRASAPAPPTAPPPPGAPAMAGLQKGMTMADVERMLGKADKTSTRTEGSLTILTATFTRGDQVISADFIEGVLVKYSISSR